MKIKTVGIVGDSSEKEELNKIAYELGNLLAGAGYSIVTGGGDGVMAAASNGAYHCKSKPSDARIIGILPGTDKSEGNKYLEHAIPTGIGWARNQIVVLSSDIVVAIGGGAGTLSEISFAWAYNKQIIAISSVDGWSSKVSNSKIDERRNDKIHSAQNAREVLEKIKELSN